MSTEPIKFLLVDDTEENLIALEALLARDGLELLMARSGAEALELLLVHDVALALLDVQMPDMNGFELAELMRGTDRTKHVPIIFVTAGAHDPKRVFKGYESGAVDFLFKPIEPHVLRSKAEVFYQLYRQRKELMEAIRLNEMFVGILGHDLRTPLNALLTGVQLLGDGLNAAERRIVVDRMTSSGQRMTRMIEQLLDLTRARLTDGLGFVGARKRLDLLGLLRRTVEELRVAHGGRQVNIESYGETMIAGDGDRLLQLFSNLIGNALQHGAAETPIDVQVEAGAREVIVRVKNRGAMPPDVLAKLFDPFHGRAGQSSKSGGLGLGLFISQQIARAHGGDVEAMSDEACGTTLTVRLPALAHAERVTPVNASAEAAH